MVFDAHSDLLYDVTRRRLLGERRVLEHHHLDRLRRGGVEGLVLAVWASGPRETFWKDTAWKDPASNLGRTHQIFACARQTWRNVRKSAGPHRSGGRGCRASGPNLRLPGGGGHGGHRREPRPAWTGTTARAPAGDAHLERDQCPGRRSRRRSSGGADGGGTPGGAPDGRTGDGGGRVPSERRRLLGRDGPGRRAGDRIPLQLPCPVRCAPEPVRRPAAPHPGHRRRGGAERLPRLCPRRAPAADRQGPGPPRPSTWRRSWGWSMWAAASTSASLWALETRGQRAWKAPPTSRNLFYWLEKLGMNRQELEMVARGNFLRVLAGARPAAAMRKTAAPHRSSCLIFCITAV